MTNTFRLAENISDKQLAVYEILGSMYHKCIFKSPLEETHLKMHFFSLSQKKQIELEEIVIKYLERHRI